jgi:glycosyltransferase involved in cell wall biosynthesis
VSSESGRGAGGTPTRAERDDARGPAAVVFVLRGVFPIPPDAGTPRPFHLLTGLRARAKVCLLAVVGQSPEAWQRFAEHPALRGAFAETRAFARRARYGPFAAARTFLAGLPALERRYKDPDVRDAAHAAARDLATAHGPVVFYCWGLPSLQWVPPEYWPASVLDLVDAPTMAIERRLASDAGLGLRERLLMRLDLPALARYERRVLARVGVATLNSSVDLDYVRRRNPDARLARVIDGGDSDYFDPAPFAHLAESDDEIVFLGNMGFPPNADAARRLALDVMPRVWRTHPRARAVLIGPDPRGALADLRGGERVVVTGFVDDVRPYLRRAALVASPVRFGAGMKNKLQSALAMEKAVVASTVTREGFDELVPGVHALVSDSDDDIAAAITALLDDPARRRALGRAGRELIRTHFSWDAAREALWRAILRCPTVGG